MSDTARITFIGAGNMASCIIGGLINNGYPAACLSASARSNTNLTPLAEELGIATSTDNSAFVQNSDVVILAVKPQNLQSVCEEIRTEFTSRSPLFISIAAGVACDSICSWLQQDVALVRCMPNTPAKVLAGASGLYANDKVDSTQKQLAQSILAAVGSVSWVEEEGMIDSVTAIAGSGPAYFFLFIEAMIDAGVAQGFDRATAETLAIQTAFGASKLAKESLQNGIDVVELRRRVTSPKGTTEQAILSFEHNNLRSTVQQAMDACRDRAQELAKLMAETKA